MSHDAPDLLSGLKQEPGASPCVVDAALENAPFELPADHLDFMRRSNGAEGAVAGTYLQLWPLETLRERNELYGVEAIATASN